MSLGLKEAAKRSNDILLKGVIELIVKDDPILERLKFKDIKGNGLTYNVEATMSSAQFYDVNEDWVETTSTIEPATAFTHILGGDADVDNFLKTTRSDVQDLMQEQIKAKTKAIRHAFNETLLYGYATTETKKFDGIHYLLRSSTYNTVAIGGSGSPAGLTIVQAEEANDMIKNGKADIVLMTKKLRREINQYLNSIGGVTKTEIQGKTVQTLCDVPIVVSDFLSNDEGCNLQYGTLYGHNYADGTALGTDQNSTSIFFVQFADDALCGVQSLGITTEKWDRLEGKDASRVRIKWYPGIMLQNILSCSKVTGISPSTTVAA